MATASRRWAGSPEPYRPAPPGHHCLDTADKLGWRAMAWQACPTHHFSDEFDHPHPAASEPGLHRLDWSDPTVGWGGCPPPSPLRASPRPAGQGLDGLDRGIGGTTPAASSRGQGRDRGAPSRRPRNPPRIHGLRRRQRQSTRGGECFALIIRKGVGSRSKTPSNSARTQTWGGAEDRGRESGPARSQERRSAVPSRPASASSRHPLCPRPRPSPGLHPSAECTQLRANTPLVLML